MTGNSTSLGRALLLNISGNPSLDKCPIISLMEIAIYEAIHCLLLSGLLVVKYIRTHVGRVLPAISGRPIG